MNELKRIVANMESVFAQSSYPQDFLAAYDQMECLASHANRETFLVQRKADGETAVATCYNRSAFPFHPDIQLLRDLSHPGLPRYYEQYQNEQMLCVVREYIEGETLSAYARDRQLAIGDIVSLAKQLCGILQALHTHAPPVVHRDIKPENIIVRPDGSLVLIDFDIARTVKAGSDTDTVFFGTRGYAPPEQYGFGQTDSRADIFSFGVLLRWLVTGSARANGNVSIDPGLQRIIDRCTAFAPENRYSDIGQVERSLENIGRGGGRGRRLNPEAVLAAALAVLLLLGAGFAAGRYTDWLRPGSKITFQEPLIERAARLQLGKESGGLTEEDLAQVTRIYIGGSEACADLNLYDQQKRLSSARGPLRTLDDVKRLPHLEELYIACQWDLDVSGIAGLDFLCQVEFERLRISDMKPIAHVGKLQGINLYGCDLSDVTALESCLWLETLGIGDNDITDLSQVGSYPRVRQLDIKTLNLKNVDDIAQRFPKLQRVFLQDSDIEDLSGLKALPALEMVEVTQEQYDAVSALFEGADVQVVVMD